MKTLAIVAGGDCLKSQVGEIQSHDLIIGVDRGAWWVLTHKIIPDYSIGDFDSVSPEELSIIKETSPNVVQYNAEKNETDLELGLQLAVSLNPKRISIYGGTGSRFDQALAGIFLLEKFHAIDITVYDETNEISVIHKQKTISKSQQFPYCSFLPLTTKAIVTLEGFKYPLVKGSLYRHQTRGISNEIVKKEGKVTVHIGKVLCIQSQG